MTVDQAMAAMRAGKVGRTTPVRRCDACGQHLVKADTPRAVADELTR